MRQPYREVLKFLHGKPVSSAGGFTGNLDGYYRLHNMYCIDISWGGVISPSYFSQKLLASELSGDFLWFGVDCYIYNSFTPMSKLSAFILVSFVLIIVSGVICFRTFKNLKKSLYWLFFPDFISIWSKKMWRKDLDNTVRFELFLVLAAVLVGINFLIFKYLF